jgi:hypothetical protein
VYVAWILLLFHFSRVHILMLYVNINVNICCKFYGLHPVVYIVFIIYVRAVDTTNNIFHKDSRCWYIYVCACMRVCVCVCVCGGGGSLS